MNFELGKIIAWLAWIGQIINGLVALLNSMPTTSAVVEQSLTGNQKTAILNVAIGLGLGILQGFLPRIQKIKPKDNFNHR